MQGEMKRIMIQSGSFDTGWIHSVQHVEDRVDIDTTVKRLDAGGPENYSVQLEHFRRVREGARRRV